MPTPFGSFPFDASGVDNFAHPLFLAPNLRAPTTNDIQNPGTQWLNNAVNPPVIYVTTGAGLWYQIAGTTGSFANLTVTGNETVGGTLGVTGASTFTALGTFTSGINTNPTVVAAGASPQVANGRSGQVVFSGVSIAAGATQTFVITNSSVSGASQVILYSLTGATTGAALTIQSVTNSSGSSSVVVQNGTGASTTTANITLTYILLN